MRLYTKSDLERAARLAVAYHVKGDEPEVCISNAAQTIANDAPSYYDEVTVKLMLKYLRPNVDTDELFEEALRYVQR